MIRPATPADVPEILTMIAELAAYEKEPDSAVATAEQLHAALFGPAPAVFARIASEPGPDGAETVVGMAVYFRTFSTWTGTHGIWLEDLYVRPGARGGGHGKKLLAALARECRDNGYARLEWTVLDWNAPAIGFYRSIGAVPMDEWTTQRLTGADLDALAGQADDAVRADGA
ncbi:GNAT family N-acetyltransferase [Tsukamurella paurometabola]|uniref:GNAT family N-acetyltransferase n=1 Tax=Tsukamurella paurometabola TaxID=2061 RepID=A0A3P8MD05_TSUPA|nr:GNAT family N-acetyltransferase [Tsukamurella paurometabola]MBS4102691.1 GNAT family N-acetyltransferase [Tsukamurella paurometabola]UEA81311.1 GNAT family N-acetyltransferase [Tsukamurella paurometabola]VDR38293.1 Predicted acetyltransferase [Tsukamurella paurometabola]